MHERGERPGISEDGVDPAKERIMLLKQQEVVIRQIAELKADFKDLQQKYRSLVEARNPLHVSLERFDVTQFLEPGRSGMPRLLEKASKYFETHDGCPFLGKACPETAHRNCQGIWVKMGTPCARFVGLLAGFSR